MGALHINGQKATGLDITLAEGAFIDADNLIFSYTINSGSISQTEYSYTATEDCYVRFMTCTPSSNQITKILIDNVEVFRIQNTSTDEIFSDSFLLKKGQVITLSNIGAYSGIGVYGIQQGTIEGKLQPVIYSEEEREIGVWTDGKPLYERTWKFTTEIALVSNTWADTPIGILANNIGKIIKVTGLYSTTSYSFLGAQCDTGDYVRILSSRPSNMLVDGLILQYTKTTDTPGAGTWTPDGAYAHHYSTDEKVIGTWVDGSTLYEKTYDLGQDVTIKYNEWTEVNATKPNGISKYINIFGTQDDGTGVVLTGANPANATFSNIRLSTRRFQDESVRWFTIQYIKTT